jgi:hypothetical protein
MKHLLLSLILILSANAWVDDELPKECKIDINSEKCTEALVSSWAKEEEVKPSTQPQKYSKADKPQKYSEAEDLYWAEEDILFDGSMLLNILPVLLIGIGIGIIIGSNNTLKRIEEEFHEKRKLMENEEQNRDELISKIDFGINMLITCFDAKQKTEKIANWCFVGAFVAILVIGFG